jgi:tol-pal system protein YbgF
MMQRPFFVFAALLSASMTLLSSAVMAQSAGGAAGNADFDQRLQRLEEQIVDLTAQVGTVETMAQGGGYAAAPSAGPSFSSGAGIGGSDDARIADMETQVRALSSQLSEILRRIDQLEQRSGGIAPSSGDTNYGSASPDRLDPEPVEQGTGFSVGGNEPAPATSGFGATIEPGPAGNNVQRGGLSGYFGGNSQGAQSAAGSGAQPVQTAARSSPDAQNLYSRAYDALVQRNYRAATEDFQQFVQTFPTDPLAGQAYFWLGEASFTNGQYKQAADSFLKSSTSYPQNEKAAESLLKLGISLRRLGEHSAACSSFSELSRRFPNATPILQRAEREKSRAQC